MTPGAAIAETHTAVVVFIGDRAYKVKKPVSFGFLDFSTVDARRTACHREVELNRRLAPDVYLGVADVVDAAGDVCDHMVVMRRMPSEQRLTACLARGDEVTEALRDVARQVAVLHERQPPDPAWTFAGSAAELRRNWQASFDELRPSVGSVLPAVGAARVDHLVDRYLTGREALFARRMADGRVRDGHGDLQADDIFLLPDGPRILDCIEFSDELRWGDVLNDVAFLAMDLERAGRDDLAEQFLSWHREFTADGWPPSLADHYIAYRAHVRAKVAALRVAQGDRDATPTARTLFDLAHAHLERARVRLTLVGGSPGTGKTSVANAIADQLPVVVLSSDELRPGASADSPTAFGAGRYTAHAVEKNYRDLVAKARELLALGESVVLDATWSSDKMRGLAREAATATASDLIELRCVAPPDVAGDRIRARQSRRDDPSEATPEIAAAMSNRFDAWPEAITIDTTVPSAQWVGRALEVLREVGHD